jgi:diguanylate cyclase (GGDEF)-like protein
MIDIDHFKAINDKEGHAAGDAVLKTLADVIRQNVRKSDVAGRVGGEEFAVLLPETTIEAAAGIAERIRSSAEERGFTLSAGVAAVGPEDKLERLMARADAALYTAKRDGRNRVVTATPPRALSAAM